MVKKTMKMAIVGASGKAGRLIMSEALERGHTVLAITRQPVQALDVRAQPLIKDLFDLRGDDVQDCAVVVDAFGTWAPETLPLHERSAAHLADMLSGRPNRLLVVGGAGSLFVNAEHTLRVMDTPDFPPAFKPLAFHMGEALEMLRRRDDVRWTYLSPAADFLPDGPRTGHYVEGGEELLTNTKGESRISYADYAVAMVDEAERAAHVQKRFTVAWA